MRGEVDAEAVRVARGEAHPIRGWVTESYLKMSPASTIMAMAPGRNRSITWRVDIG